MRYLAWCGLVLLTLTFNVGCERAAYMEPREAPEDGIGQESERRFDFREPGYRPYVGDQENEGEGEREREND